MPKLARGLIDLEEAYGDLLLDKQVALLRNIRTKVSMSKLHHCEDKECGGGAPKAKCIQKLHFAWCLAPIVDKDPHSPTYGQVVIHGERIVCLSPSGCPDHPFGAEFNLDLRNARNNRPNFKVLWKGIFEEFKAEHEANKAREAERMEAVQKQMRMTGHQKRTMQARQDEKEYLQRKEREEMAKFNGKLSRKNEIPEATLPAEISSMPRAETWSASIKARAGAESGQHDPGKLAISIGAVTDEEVQQLLAPQSLYGEVFQDLDSGPAKGDGEIGEWEAFNLQKPAEKDLAVPTSEWLKEELYRKPEVETEEEPPSKEDPIPAPDNVNNAAEAAEDRAICATKNVPEMQGRRKDNKQAKKLRAAEMRAKRRTIMAEMEAKVAEEELAQMAKARMASTKKGGRRAISAGRT